VCLSQCVCVSQCVFLLSVNVCLSQCVCLNYSFLAVLDKHSGKILWSIKRTSRGSWSTPVLVRAVDQKTGKSVNLILINGGSQDPDGAGNISAYDLNTGKVVWYYTGTTPYVVPVPLLGKKLIYSTSGRMSGPIFAIKPHFNSSASTRRKTPLWQIPNGGNYTASGVFYRGKIYMVSYGGVLGVYNPAKVPSDFPANADATRLTREHRIRLGGGVFDASLVAGDGKIYVSNKRGNLFVVDVTGSEPTIIARKGFSFKGQDGEKYSDPLFATPALHEGNIYVRTKYYLYKFGADK